MKMAFFAKIIHIFFFCFFANFANNLWHNGFFSNECDPFAQDFQGGFGQINGRVGIAVLRSIHSRKVKSITFAKVRVKFNKIAQFLPKFTIFDSLSIEVPKRRPPRSFRISYVRRKISLMVTIHRIMK